MSEKSLEHPLQYCFAVFKDHESWQLANMELMLKPEPFPIFASRCSRSRKSRRFIFKDQSAIDALLAETDPTLQAFKKVVASARAASSPLVLTASEFAGKTVSFEDSADPAHWLQAVFEWQPSEFAISLLDDEGSHCLHHMLSDENYLYGILEAQTFNLSITRSDNVDEIHLGEPERVTVLNAKADLGEADRNPEEPLLRIYEIGTATGYLIPEDPNLPVNFLFVWDSRAVIWNQPFPYPQHFSGRWVESRHEPRVPCERRIIEKFERPKRLMPADVISAGSGV